MILPNIPLWLLSITIFVLALFSIETGYRLGILIHCSLKLEKESNAFVISSSIPGLLRFLPALTLGINYERFGGRKDLVRDEAAWLPLPGRDQISWLTPAIPLQ